MGSERAAARSPWREGGGGDGEVSLTPPPPGVPSARAEPVVRRERSPVAAGAAAAGGMRTAVIASLLRDVCGSKGCGKGGETQPVRIILKIKMLCFREMLCVDSPQGYIRNGITASNSNLSPV